MPNYVNLLSYAIADNDEKMRMQEQKFRNKELIGTPDNDKVAPEVIADAVKFIDNSANMYDDPAFDSIRVLIDFGATDGLFASENNMNSALRYLRDTGETERYQYLKQVIEELTDLFSNEGQHQYLLKNVDGLGQINENFTKLGQDVELSFQFFETVTWKVRGILSLLREVLYDSVRQLEVLPVNLRVFSMFLYISDIRQFKTTTELFDIQDNFVKPDDIAKMFYTDDYVKQAMIVSLLSCQINAFGNLPETVSNIDQQEVESNLKVTAKTWAINDVLPAIGTVVSSVVKDSTNTRDSKSLWELAKLAAKSTIKHTIASTLKHSLAMARSYAMSMSYQALEKYGVTNIINEALQYTKPEFLASKSIEELRRGLTNETSALVNSVYVPKLGSVDVPDITVEKIYMSNLGKVDEQ